MEVVILADAEAVAHMAAAMVAKAIHDKPEAVLGLATGSTPRGLYARLVAMVAAGHLDMSGVTTFNLDEYVGLDPADGESYHAFMRRELFEHVPLRRSLIPDGQAADIAAACEAYEQAIAAAGGIDLQVLGIGHDGHIGFNEPTSSLASRTRIKTLADATVAANQRFFADRAVPRHVITMGIGTILESRHCLMLALGAAKAAAVAAMIEGPITHMCPASGLQMHPRTTVLLDEAAASQLRLQDYYRSVWAHKPEWQRQAMGIAPIELA
jgi:glucosamine-6-phosphate deaminase